MSEKRDNAAESEDDELLSRLGNIPVDNPEFFDVQQISRGENFEFLSSAEIERAYSIVVESEKRANAGLSEEEYKNQERQRDVNKWQRKDLEAKILFWTRLVLSGILLSLCIVWMCFIAWLLIKCGTRKVTLSDAVLVALITTTTIQVLGIYYIVANWLFPKRTPTDVK